MVSRLPLLVGLLRLLRLAVQLEAMEYPLPPFNLAFAGPSGEALVGVSTASLVQGFEENASQVCMAFDLAPQFWCYPVSSWYLNLSGGLAKGHHRAHVQAYDSAGRSLHPPMPLSLFVEHETWPDPTGRAAGGVLFLDPAYGAIVEHTSTEAIIRGSLRLFFMVAGASTNRIWWPEDLLVRFQVAGQDPFDVVEPTNNIVLTSIETGTHVIYAQAYDRFGRLGVPAMTTFDTVISPQQIRRHSRFVAASGLLHPPLSPSSSSTASTKRQLRILFVGMLKFDGQKTIWLNQMRLLSRSRYRMEYITFSDQYSDSPMIGMLRDLEVPLFQEPLPSVSYEELDEAGVKNALGEPATETDIIPILIQELDRARNRIDAVGPEFARRVWAHLVYHLESHRPDILVFANAREASDLLLTRAARVARVPRLVMELPNLFPIEGVEVDAFVAPSHYVAAHHSVRAAAALSAAPCFVINPGVNTTDYDPDDRKMMFCHPKCATTTGLQHNHHDFRCKTPCPVIAFLARLSSEKSPALFLQACAIVARSWPFARFLVIGDGPMLEPLKDQAQKLGIQDLVHFTGGIFENLAAHLRGVDILVNPSLRAWSETFCIVNIEAMAMEIPVVTFGVGGVGEYLQDPTNNRTSCRIQGALPSAASPEADAGEVATCINDETQLKQNGVLVDDPTPQALAEAITKLLRNTTFRLEVGKHARRTVLQRFTIEHMVNHYDNFYSSLALDV